MLSTHVVVEDFCFFDGHAPQVLDQLQACVADHFPVSVEHSTFQRELAGQGAVNRLATVVPQGVCE